MDNSLFSLYSLTLFFSALASVILAIILLNHRKVAGVIFLSFVFICISIWLLGASFETAMITIEKKIFWSKVEYVGMVNVLPFMFVFVRIYFNKGTKGFQKKYLLLWIIPVVILSGALTNERHGLLWRGFSNIDPNTNFLFYERGFLFYLSILYSFGIITVILITLLRELFLYKDHLYRTQIILMISALILPLAGTAMNYFRFSPFPPFPGFDWNVLLMFLSTFFISMNILRFGFADLVPIARDILVDNLESGVLVVDPLKRITDYNQRFLGDFELNEKNIFGKDASKIFSEMGLGNQNFFDNQIPQLEMEFDWTNHKIYKLAITPLKKSPDKLIGWLFVFHDITEIRQTEIQVQEVNKKLTEQLAETERLKNILEDQAVRDPLTGLYNRRYLEETLEREISRAIRKMHFVALLMLDIDYFKKVNDRYGHDIGDQVLCGMAEVLNLKSRKEDVSCRFGGEEFLLLIPDISAKAALDRAEEIRLAFIQRCFDMSEQIEVTVSVGVAIYPQHADTPKMLFRRADQALYTAKHKGRNRVCLASEEGMDE